MSSYLGNLASDVWEDLGEPSTTCVENINGWFIANVGKLNNYLGTCYSGVDGTGISPCLGNKEQALFAQLYKIRYYERRIDDNLGAGSYSVVELREGDSTIRVASRTELAKTYKDLKNQEQGIFKEMLNSYKSNKAAPEGISFY